MLRTIISSFFLIIISFSINAELIEGYCDGSPDASVTCDTETGVEWLDLTETLGMSVNDFNSDVGGWVSNGWSIASGDLVDQLLLNAGFSALDGVFRNEDLGAAYIMRVVGITSGSTSSPGGWRGGGLIETPECISGIAGPSYRGGQFSIDAGLAVGQSNCFPGDTSSSFSTVGVWAVRNQSDVLVPEPIFVEDFELITSIQTEIESAMEREDGTFQLSAVVPGWTLTGVSNQFIKINGISGNTSLVLNEFGDSPNTISRVIDDLVPGVTYQLTFEHWGDNCGPCGYSFDWEINGSTFSVAEENFIVNSGNFRTVVYEFTPSSSSTLLRFSETSTSAGSPNLDNIEIKPLVIPIFSEDFEEITSTQSEIASAMEREDGTFQLSAVVPGWSLNGVSNQFIKINGISGNTSLVLNEFGDNPNTISRIIDNLIPGVTHQLSFEHWGDNCGPCGYSFDWEINGSTFSVAEENFIVNSGNFRTVVYEFTPSLSSTLLRFSETSTSAGSPNLDNILISIIPPENEPPTAVAGLDQSIRIGDNVFLDGSSSFDDNTSSENLIYSWSFSFLPVGSSATLLGMDTPTPSFIADVADTYAIELVVIDENGLSSQPDEVLISADNLAPTSSAGDDQLVVIGTEVNLDGSTSSDPESDPLTYLWAINSAPSGSAASIIGNTAITPSFTPDVEGVYEISLIVSDLIGSGPSDTVLITAASAEDFSETQIVSGSTTIINLPPNDVTTQGNQNALLNFLSQAVEAIQNDELIEAIDKLEKAISRTDGCILRGEPDGNGKGRDWITNCSEQVIVYDVLNDALEALAQ